MGHVLLGQLWRGEVIDFLDVYVPPGGLADRFVAWFGTSHWPTFNVADSAIVVGAGCLLVATFLTPHAAPAGRGDGKPAGAGIES